jgi:hypothetical protein
VLVVVLTGTVFVQALMVWALVSGSDPEDGSLPLTPLRVITILGMVSVQVAVVCVWRLVTMVRRGTDPGDPVAAVVRARAGGVQLGCTDV